MDALCRPNVINIEVSESRLAEII